MYPSSMRYDTYYRSPVVDHRVNTHYGHGHYPYNSMHSDNAMYSDGHQKVHGYYKHYQHHQPCTKTDSPMVVNLLNYIIRPRWLNFSGLNV